MAMTQNARRTEDTMHRTTRSLHQRRNPPGRAARAPAQVDPNGKSLIIVESPPRPRPSTSISAPTTSSRPRSGTSRTSRRARSGSTSRGASSPSTRPSRGRTRSSQRLRSHARPARAPSIWRPTRTAKARRSPGISPRRSRTATRRSSACCSTRSPSAGSPRRCSIRCKIDENLVNSQQARRVMDRLVGYKISPFVWKTVFYGLSAGRVQSVAVRLICEREEAINSFMPQEYWSIIGGIPRRTAASRSWRSSSRWPARIPVIGDATTAEGYVDGHPEADVQHRGHPEEAGADGIRRAPFITSTLQQEAARRLRFHAKRTMMLAQKLYEGVELGEDGRVGLITYMRTDSTRLSDDAVQGGPAVHLRELREGVSPARATPLQEGEEVAGCARGDPADLARSTPRRRSRSTSTRRCIELYELIWNRFVACQMSAAVFEQTTVDVTGATISSARRIPSRSSADSSRSTTTWWTNRRSRTATKIPVSKLPAEPEGG